MGAAARRGVRGTPRPAAFGGPLCGLPNAMLANQRFTFGEPRNPVFYYWHNPPTNAPRSPVRRSVSISDNLSYGNSDGTNRSQNADRECSGFDKVTVTRLNIFKLQYAASMTSAEVEQHTIPFQFFCVLNQITTQSVRVILSIEFLIQQFTQIRCRTTERPLFHHEVMNGKRENVRRRRCDFIARRYKYYLCEAANSLRRCDPEFKRFYTLKYQEATKHKHKRTLVLTARKLVRLVYTLLKTNRLYIPPEV